MARTKQPQRTEKPRLFRVRTGGEEWQTWLQVGDLCYLVGLPHGSAPPANPDDPDSYMPGQEPFRRATPSPRAERCYLHDDELEAKRIVAQGLAFIRRQRARRQARYRRELEQRASLVEASARAQERQATLLASLDRFPYFFRRGRFEIPRVFRVEKDRKGRLRARIYDRKHDAWGKTLLSIRRIDGVLDNAAFAAWQQRLGTVFDLAVPFRPRNED
jgi:hypothetical protein